VKSPSTTNAAEYGSPAPGATAGLPTAEGYFPLKFEEPVTRAAMIGQAQ